MQSLDYTEALAESLTKLKAPELSQLLGALVALGPNVGLTDSTKAQFSELIFAMRTAFQNLERDEKVVMDSLGFGEITNSKFLGELVNKFHSAINKDQVAADARFWVLYYTLRATLNLQRSLESLLVTPKTSAIRENASLVELTIEDYDDKAVFTRRFAEVLKELADLYDVIGQALGHSNDASRILYVDSGTRITIALEGLADTIDAISRLFETVWLTLRYSGLEKFDRQIASVDKGLSFIAGLRERVASGDIDAESAEKLEIAAKRHMGKLIGAGVMRSQVEETVIFDRSDLLESARDTRLLKSGEGN
jgi:hypothetical protein